MRNLYIEYIKDLIKEHWITIAGFITGVLIYEFVVKRFL